MSAVRTIFQRRAELLRELAELEAALGEALAATERPDETIGLTEAAQMFGEPSNTFRQRLEYRKALVSRPGERRLRFSRRELERIKADRLAEAR